MRIINFERGGSLGIAADEGSGWHGLTQRDGEFPGTLPELIAQGADLLRIGRKLGQSPAIDLNAVRLLPPVPVPPGARGLRIQGRLNGRVMQDSRTDLLIFGVATLIETISVAMSLERGDVIITGTPGGVGAARKPPVFMKAGDIFEVEIEKLGVLTNPVQDG